MTKRFIVVALALASVGSVAQGVELRMQWEGLDADARTIELAVGEQAVFEVHLDGFADDDSISGMYFENEDASGLVLIDAATEIAGWTTTVASDMTFGEPGEQVIYFGVEPEDFIESPDDLLVGTVTFELQSGNVGDEFEITFNLSFTSILNSTAGTYSRTTTGSATQDNPGRYHVGAGSPGYTQLGVTDLRDPLIVRVKQGSTSGGGGGGGGGGGTGGGDTGGGDTGGGDTGGGDTGGGDTGGGDTGGGDTGGVDNGGGDTGGGDTGGGDTGGVDNGGGDTGGGDTGGGDTGGGDTGGGDTGGSGGQDNGNDQGNTGGGLCGLGVAPMLPIMLLGLAGLKSSRRRHSRWVS
ncbi:MAG: hypothetical protein H6817_07675 [Phycisphaerales bacterium]|nr:hypothetical protein [Phycisphaerales bacterium]